MRIYFDTWLMYAYNYYWQQLQILYVSSTILQLQWYISTTAYRLLQLFNRLATASCCWQLVRSVILGVFFQFSCVDLALVSRLSQKKVAMYVLCIRVYTANLSTANLSTANLSTFNPLKQLKELSAQALTVSLPAREKTNPHTIYWKPWNQYKRWLVLG